MRVPIDFRSAIAFWQIADTCKGGLFWRGLVLRPRTGKLWYTAAVFAMEVVTDLLRYKNHACIPAEVPLYLKVLSHSLQSLLLSWTQSTQSLLGNYIHIRMPRCAMQSYEFMVLKFRQEGPQSEVAVD